LASLSAILASAAPALKDVDGLEPALRELLDGARAAWPTLKVSDADFLAYLAARLPSGEEPLAAIRSINAGDLYLACACARGVPGALVQLDRRYLSGVRDALARSLGVSLAFVDDVQQALREKLFIAQGGKPARILSYGGRGSLGSWLRSAAIRTALNLRPAARDEPLDELFSERAVSSDDQELRLLKTRCRKEFKDAFRKAIAQLGTDEVECLRLNLIEGLSIDRLAELYGISRATAARRLASARKKLMELTKEQLSERLGLSSGEVRSVVGLVRSQLDLSLHQYLGKDD
jgi:RNA polymerase sigma-70 factor (ECF subfamily)